MKRVSAGFLVFGVLLVSTVKPSPSFGASFDCSRATAPVEQMICADQRLSVLDERYAAAYGYALKKATDPKAFKREASAWLKNIRNACPTTECLSDAYLSRIDALEGARSTSSFSFKFSDLSKTEQEQLLKLGGWGILGTLVFLIVLGLTNRVVIFYNAADAWWSISPLLFLVGAAIIAATLAPEGAKEFATTPIEKAVLAGGGLGAVLGIIMTFYNAIRYNRNLFLGVLVGACKVIVSLLMAVTFIGSFSGVFPSRNTARGDAVFFALVVMLVGFLWVALVNGERVYEKKGWKPAEA